MTRYHLQIITCCTLLTACAGPGNDDIADDYTETENTSDLEARVAAITGEGLPQEGYQQGEMGTEATGNGQDDGQPAQGGTRTLTIHNTQFNVPMAHIDLPARWPVRTKADGDWYVDAPGLKVKGMQGGSFMYAGGQFGQFYQQGGGQMRAPMAPDQVVMQDVVPNMRQQGAELIGITEIPMVARADQQGLDGLYSIGQTRKTCRAALSEWRKGDERIALVLHWFAFESPEMTNWGYRITGLQAAARNYEQDKAALVNSLASVRWDRAYFAAYAQSEQQKEGQSWAAHNQRMASNQAAFDARQAAHRDMVNGVNNAIMGTWNSSNASMDRQQEATINGIRGEQNAWNPHTGQQGKVEAGYSNYWVNSDGQYFGTNDVMYDPNANGQSVDQWQQMETEP